MTTTAAEETCSNQDIIAVGDGDFSLINNQWSTTAAEQCIQQYDDNSYGWSWNRGSTDTDTPNYPQTLIGTKPWGSNTNSLQFPIQRGDVDQLEFELAVDRTVSGSKWNLAEEWWLTSEKPGTDVSNAIEHEVMLVLDWGPDLTQGGVIESDAITDKYGNSIDYWSNYKIGWNFHIFRIAAQQVPDVVDLSAIIAYMSENIDSVSPDLWITGVELGNEYWDDTSGSTRINQFDVTLNGETATSGPGSGQDTTAPTNVTWVTPSDSETVSGTITGQIDAADSEDSDDSLDVTYTVDGGSSRSATYDSTSGYYEDSWDTTGVSDGDHTLEATAIDSAGNSSSSSISVTMDNTGSVPTVDNLSLSEVETSDSDAAFDVDWSVSDTDDNLNSVDLVLTQDSDGSTEDSTTVGVSGSLDSGTTQLVAAGDDGSGNSYTVDATVTDSDGNSGSGSTSVSETEDTNGAPSASIDSLNNRSNPAWDRFTVDWSASDSDGNLDTVVVELLDSSGSVLDSASENVSGSAASDSHEVRSKQNGVDIVVTATDTDGVSGSDSGSI